MAVEQESKIDPRPEIVNRIARGITRLINTEIRGLLATGEIPRANVFLAGQLAALLLFLGTAPKEDVPEVVTKLKAAAKACLRDTGAVFLDESDFD